MPLQTSVSPCCGESYQHNTQQLVSILMLSHLTWHPQVFTYEYVMCNVHNPLNGHLLRFTYAWSKSLEFWTVYKPTEMGLAKSIICNATNGRVWATVETCSLHCNHFTRLKTTCATCWRLQQLQHLWWNSLLELKSRQKHSSFISIWLNSR